MVRENHYTDAHTDVTERLPHELPTTREISTAAASHQLNGSMNFWSQAVVYRQPDPTQLLIDRCPSATGSQS
jgi:hypothetical protein